MDVADFLVDGTDWRPAAVGPEEPLDGNLFLLCTAVVPSLGGGKTWTGETEVWLWVVFLPFPERVGLGSGNVTLEMLVSAKSASSSSSMRPSAYA